jgi:hypothetical protein
VEYIAPVIIEGKGQIHGLLTAMLLLLLLLLAGSFFGISSWLLYAPFAALTWCLVCVSSFSSAGPTASLAPWSTWPPKSLRARAMAAP